MPTPLATQKGVPIDANNLANGGSNKAGHPSYFVGSITHPDPFEASSKVVRCPLDD